MAEANRLGVKMATAEERGRGGEDQRSSSARGRGEMSHHRAESVTRRYSRGDPEQTWPRGRLEAMEAEPGGSRCECDAG